MVVAYIHQYDANDEYGISTRKDAFPCRTHDEAIKWLSYELIERFGYTGWEWYNQEAAGMRVLPWLEGSKQWIKIAWVEKQP